MCQLIPRRTVGDPAHGQPQRQNLSKPKASEQVHARARGQKGEEFVLQKLKSGQDTTRKKLDRSMRRAREQRCHCIARQNKPTKKKALTGISRPSVLGRRCSLFFVARATHLQPPSTVAGISGGTHKAFTLMPCRRAYRNSRYANVVLAVLCVFTKAMLLNCVEISTRRSKTCTRPHPRPKW